MATETRYLIRRTRHFFAGNPGVVRSTYGGTHAEEHGFGSDVPLIPFLSRQAAAEAIERIESQRYVRSSGESGHPDYYLVPESKWPASIDAVVAMDARRKAEASA